MLAAAKDRYSKSLKLLLYDKRYSDRLTNQATIQCYLLTRL